MADGEYQKEDEKVFHKAFYQMVDIVEKLFADYQERLENMKTKKEKAKDNALGKGKDPYDPSSPSSCSSSKCSITASSNPKKILEKTKSNLPYLKLDIKWESKTHEDLLTKGKIISSWYEFIVALKKKFYPLGYIQQAMIDWKKLRQGKGQNV